MTIDKRRQRARQWLETIYGDVQDLLLDVHIFWQVQVIIKSNPVLTSTPSHFFHWMMAAHVESVVMGVRRQVKRDENSISLRRFLEEVKQFPDIVSRAHHVTLCTELSSTLPAKFHEHTFDRLVGVSRFEADPATVHAEIEDLLRVAAKIEHYADRRFAHYDGRGLTQERPKFNEIEASLAVCEKLIRRYKVLLDGVDVTNLLPVFQYDWTEIFRHPWIASEET